MDTSPGTSVPGRVFDANESAEAVPTFGGREVASTAIVWCNLVDDGARGVGDDTEKYVPHI